MLGKMGHTETIANEMIPSPKTPILNTIKYRTALETKQRGLQADTASSIRVSMAYFVQRK
jgi:hypothetical protein